MDELLASISKIFKKFGIKCISMDDIAQQLGKSKKTLYQHFKNKNDVIVKLAQFELRSELDELENLSNLQLNAIDQFMAISKYLVTKIFNLNHALLHDMKKYHPSIWYTFQAQRELQIGTVVNRNLQMGMKQGLYLENFKAEAFILSYLLRLHFIDYELYVSDINKSYNEIYDTLFLYHNYSIANDTGIRYLQEKYKQ